MVFDPASLKFDDKGLIPRLCSAEDMFLPF